MGTETRNATIAWRYVRRIRNSDKRWYASTYLAYALGEQGEPSRPAGLSYMAAQAVRMEINEILHCGVRS